MQLCSSGMARNSYAMLIGIVEIIVSAFLLIEAMSPVPFSPITVPRPTSMYEMGAGGYNMGVAMGMGVAGGSFLTSVSPATAEIVANQSQDYIDEQLAEYQNQIQILQGRSERMSFYHRNTYWGQILLEMMA